MSRLPTFDKMVQNAETAGITSLAGMSALNDALSDLQSDSDGPADKFRGLSHSHYSAATSGSLALGVFLIGVLAKIGQEVSRIGDLLSTYLEQVDNEPTPITP